MDIAGKIFELLDQKRIEQKEFAEQLGLSPARVSEWRKRTSKSYLKYLPQIAEVLNTSVEYLLTGEEKKPAAAPSQPDVLVKFNALSPDGQKEVLAFIEFKQQQENRK